MNFLTSKILLATAAAALFTASASAQVLKVGGVGSSAMFQTATIEAYQEAINSAGVAGYYVAKNNGLILDQRGDSNIVPQLGNLSVVWDNGNAPTNVWYYLSVDSGVGNRAYFSVPRAQLGVVSPAVAPSSSVINPAFFGGAAPQAIPAAVLAIINNSTFTAAFTDIRPEDAMFATNRANCGNSTNYTLGCLGYGTSDPYAGAQIKSGSPLNTGSQAQAVAFNIFGSDPITGGTIPAWQTVPVGVAPIIFIANRTNPNGLGSSSFTGFNYQASPVLLFTGLDCDTSAFGLSGAPLAAINPIEREPFSGTMNTFEYTVMLPYWSQYSKQNFWFSQEGILSPPYVMPGPNANNLGNWGALNPATNNPLAGGCPANGVNNGWAGGPQGNRYRAIGTGEEVNTVKATADSIGYLFFSYGNVSGIAGSANYGYLTYGEWGGGAGGALIPTDPINPSGTYGASYTYGNITFPGNGQLPTCTAPCPMPANKSFPNVRSGAYLQWSLLRAVADTGTTNYTNLVALTTGIANQVNLTSPDFVPFGTTADGDQGIQFYRSHFSPVGINYNATNTPNNGVSGQNGVYQAGTEAGGDVGGCVDWRYAPNGPTNLLNCRY
jgi:hypothetical protein